MTRCAEALEGSVFLDKHFLDDLKALYAALFPPEIRDALTHEGGRLVIIPDSVLNYVPFCALRTEDNRYLIEKYELVYWPSVTVWLLTEHTSEVRRLIGKPHPGSVSVNVFADPVFPAAYSVSLGGQAVKVKFDALPGTALEANRIREVLKARVFTQKDATLEALGEVMRDTGIIHLATHGFLNEDDPESSFVLLADGALTARELYQNDTGIRSELVMLSACQTGLGTNHPDSSIGLTNAFLVSGANSVGSTLWQIPDDASARLMASFYGELARGESLPASLRKAQLDIMNESAWRDPYNWAAYKITGRLENPLKLDDTSK